MDIKNKIFFFFIFFSIFTLSIINIKNSDKIKFYFFTSKIEEVSLGNLITITFISGFTFSSLISIISKNNIQIPKDDLQESLSDDFINNEDIDKNNQNFNQEFEYDRPPERDVRESQPTISVNYRFVDQDSKSYRSKNTINNKNNDDDDWEDYDNEW